MKTLKYPSFFPDATSGVVRGVDSTDLREAGIEGIVVNTYHLFEKLGSNRLKKLKGIKNLMNWDGYVISDSGGFQILSLLYSGVITGKIEKDGIRIKDKKTKSKFYLTPEKSIQTQFRIKSDLMVCLDDCAPPDASNDDIKKSVDRTIDWSKRCKDEFEKQCELKKFTKETKPKIFGVIQGASNYKERERCAKELIDIGFDGFGFGGWPLNEDKTLNYEMLKFTADLMPDNTPKYAMGVGNPKEIIECNKLGYTIFDCVLPTRDARHQRLYVLNSDPTEFNLAEIEPPFSYVYINDKKHSHSDNPISDYCDCHTCANFSLAYIHYLFEIGDRSAERLATIHNLRTYQLLINNIRKFANE